MVINQRKVEKSAFENQSEKNSVWILKWTTSLGIFCEISFTPAVTFCYGQLTLMTSRSFRWPCKINKHCLSVCLSITYTPLKQINRFLPRRWYATLGAETSLKLTAYYIG